MAAFTTLAVLGLGAYFAGRASKKGTQAAPVAPGPSTAATSIAAPPLPPTAQQTQSTAVAAGIQAAGKTRRKLAPQVPGPKFQPVSASLQPKSLVGY